MQRDLAVPASVTSPGAMLGDFAITRELGTGGMVGLYRSSGQPGLRGCPGAQQQFASDANLSPVFRRPTPPP